MLERWTGKVSLADLAGHKRHLAEDPSPKPRASVLSDGTRASIDISPDAICKLAELESDRDGASPVSRYAFLVSDEAYERAQRFAEEAKKYGKTVIVFNSLEVAAAWLGMDLSEVVELQGRFSEQGHIAAAA